MTLTILDNGLAVENDTFRHLWFRLQNAQNQVRFRAIALRELTALVIEDQEMADFNVLGKQWGALRGLYNAGVDFVYTAAGMFTPEHIGVVQFYGAAGDGESLDEATGQAHAHLGAVEATLANFQQSQTRPPLTRWMEWYLEFVTSRAQHVVAILGHPDPREARGSLGKDGNLPTDEAGDLALEQNEMLFRGLAKLREDFVFQVTADYVGRKELTQRMLRVAQETSNVASRRRGSLSIGASLSIPLAAALSNSYAGGHSTTGSQTHSISDGVSHGEGQSHTTSYSHGTSSSTSVTESEAHGLSITHTDSAGLAKSLTHTAGTSDTFSSSHTDSHSTGVSESVAQSSGGSHTVSSGWNTGTSTNESSGTSTNQSQGTSTNQAQGTGTSQGASSGTGTSQGTNSGTSTGTTSTASQSENWGEGSNWNVNSSVNVGANGSVGIPGVASVGASGGVSVGGGVGGSSSTGGSTGTGTGTSTSTNSGSSTGSSTSQSTSIGSSASQSFGTGTSQSNGSGASQSSGSGTSQGFSGGVADSESWGTTVSHGTNEGWGTADTQGIAHGTSQSQATGFSTNVGTADSVSESVQWSKSVGSTSGVSDTWGVADGKSEENSQSHTEGDALGLALGRNGTQGFTGGFSTGLIPGININRSWQTEDDVADRVTEVLRQLEGLLNQASAEGGFLAEAVLLTASARGAAACEALAPQAFHGPNSVPTPVLTVIPPAHEAGELRRHALAFVPHPLQDPHDPYHALGGKYSTLLTAHQVAAYTAPGVFREGTVRIIPAIPKTMGFYPDMPGDVLLGHQYSPETADLTTAKVLLDKARFMHIMFAGATGFGKSVAAMRLVYEIALRWQMRVVVLDFGYAWRQLLNAPGLEGQGKVDVRQLNPHGVRPLRWNPLQISRYVNPEEQMKAFADIFGTVAQLGQKQQQHRLLEALENVYLRAGVLVDDPQVRRDAVWGQVVDQDEANQSGSAVGRELRNLTADQRQRLAQHRSRAVDLLDLYAEIEARRDAMPARDQVGRGVLDGILVRLSSLVRGAAATQFAKGDTTLDVAELGAAGVLILEGGKFLNQFTKAWLLGWAGWLLYTDMVKQREKQLISGDAELFMVFEEANIIFSGLDRKDDEGGGTVSEQYDSMFRDSRKYGVRFGVITQSPSLIPPGVRSSCSSLIAGYLTEGKDKDVVLAALAKSEKGFVDEPWRRFLSDENIGMVIGRLPYSFDRQQMRPFLFRPLMLKADEPNDLELETKLGRIPL